MRISGTYPWGTTTIEPDLRYLSLGAGVQSTCVMMMIVEGELPMVDCAIFADTGWEPQWTYDHLKWLQDRATFPVHVVSYGNIREDALKSRDGESRWAAIPLHVLNKDGDRAMLRRQCTREFKITPIERKVRELLGLESGQRAAGRFVVESVQGISYDELTRMKESRTSWIWNNYPLIERRMTRTDCLRWLSARGYPEPPKSACIGCPYHDDEYWRDLKTNAPADFADAVEFDREIRNGSLRGVDMVPFVHRSLVPLEDVDFTESSQLDLWGFQDECDGMCGV
jgi:hypothetical protein